MTALIIAWPTMAQRDVQRDFQRKLIDASDESVIELPAGTWFFDGTLWLDGKSRVTIRGAGEDKTILDFGQQVSGGEGLKITDARNIVIENLTVQNTKGDAIKAQMVDGLVLRHVSTIWTRGPHKTNGGYGLYPVQCKNVLIEHCTASGASDAGIYVGQSRHIIVRNNKAFRNVAGIEIENSLYADVYDNDVYDNTGGVLVFDLPDLTEKRGGFVRVFNNTIRENNHKNFAPPGNIVGQVPPGTGVMILAAKNVEVFDNRIVGNITAGAAIISYHMTENPVRDTSYHAYPGDILIANNHFERPRVRATGKGRMGKMYRFKLRFGRDVPHIVYDGIEDPHNRDRRNICIVENTNATFADIDAENGFKNISRDLKPHDCALERLAPASVSSVVQP